MSYRAPGVEASVEIAAPIELVWQVMLDLPRYPDWNPFVVGIADADKPVVVGRPLLLDVCWVGGGSVKSTEVVTVIEPPAPSGTGRTARLCYEFGGLLPALYLVRATRTQRLEELAPGRARYATWEDMGPALLNGFVPYGKMKAGFEVHAQALKRRAESLASQAAEQRSAR
jgi:hypothetical protein